MYVMRNEDLLYWCGSGWRGIAATSRLQKAKTFRTLKHAKRSTANKEGFVPVKVREVTRIEVVAE